MMPHFYSRFLDYLYALPPRKLFLGGLLICYTGIQTYCTIKDTSIFPFSPYNMFNKPPKNPTYSLKIRTWNTSGEDFVYPAEALLPIDFFIARKHIFNSLQNMTSEEFDHFLIKSLERIKNEPWTGFDEVSSPLSCHGICKKIEIEIWRIPLAMNDILVDSKDKIYSYEILP